ncbi:DUF1080 domain-containing protein [Flavobacteriaceae bacterium F89]|uniref:DUF1080 domain-containing protein n=1 Tax=Cerina litoralis TaxID=2874477 RepID=A0AAE3JP40_9FLAO|nr:DUF1080 domain-containing protein [Cerina litoralis]MCG2461730.1 DUF1080 domain-containing protein [Cerina litoralis]
MKLKLLLFLGILISIGVQGQTTDPKMKSLFNGKDLKHWKVPDNNIWWTVKDGILYGHSDPTKTGSYLWTKSEYKDFVVQLDFKFGEGTVDSGIFMRGEDARNPQIQIGISGSLKRDMTASPYVPKRGYPVEAKGVRQLLKKNDWNTLKARAVGNTYTVWLNGKEVMNYTLDNANLEGPVGLQVHPGKDMSIAFKNISLAKL